MTPKIIALIPARAGSVRIRDKNIYRLGGHPLIAHTIQAAHDADIFARIIVATDSEDYAAIARHYGAETPALRPPEISHETAPDIQWVEWIVAHEKLETQCNAVSILRPTAPLRRAETIQKAWKAFHPRDDIDSLRAVSPVAEHPGKMWVVEGDTMRPLLPHDIDGVPWHSSQKSALPEIHVQNASLEIAWMRTIMETRSIAGQTLMPFVSEGHDGFDINTPDDLLLLETLIKTGKARLADIPTPPFKG